MLRWVVSSALYALPIAAFAHAARDDGNSFLTGFLHPGTGADHALAMLAVGLWGAQLGGAAVWVLPVAFPLVMALGAAAGIAGLPMIAVEPGIAFSVLALGFAIAARARPPLAAAGVLVAAFAVLHGYAHGVEMPRQADALAYGAGFVLATGLIHLAGIGVGQLARLPRGASAVRVIGAAIGAWGVVLVARWFGMGA